MVSIASENVTEILSVIETPFWLSVGEVEETVGAVVSVEEESVVVEDVFSVDADEPPSSLPQEIMVRLKSDIRITCKILFIFSFQQL